MSKRWNHRLAG